MASIRLLLYFCIERILYNMYELNGYDKMTQKSKDIPFMEKQIQMGLI